MSIISPTMLNGIMLLWFLLTGLSVVYVATDIRRTPESAVLKWAFVLITAYTGPIGAFLYVLGCREPLPGLHERYIAARWRQVLGSTMHCVAGDGAGILVGAIIGAFFSLTGAADLAVEYLLGFGFGWTIFQALFMKGSVGGNYRHALQKTFIPEFVSMNALMAGMIPVMRFGMTTIMGSHSPGNPAFWFVMSIALLIGFIIAYPVNWWLVTHHLKHGMMTIRPSEPQPIAMMAAGESDRAQVEKGEHRMEPVSRRVQFLMVVLTCGLLALSIGSVALLGWL
ncbi:MAG: DUF4396 domain-containing protein [Ktedonobacteraceae bacterium]